MGMSDTQFKAYIRSLELQVKDAREESDAAKKDEKLDRLLEVFKHTLED